MFCWYSLPNFWDISLIPLKTMALTQSHIIQKSYAWQIPKKCKKMSTKQTCILGKLSKNTLECNIRNSQTLKQSTAACCAYYTKNTIQGSLFKQLFKICRQHGDKASPQKIRGCIYFRMAHASFSIGKFACRLCWQFPIFHIYINRQVF